jgi:hypothetical protein
MAGRLADATVLAFFLQDNFRRLQRRFNKMLPGESGAEEASAVEPILNPKIIAEAKEELAKRLSGKKYRPIIPAETHPPIDINRQPMEKYRPLMERHYKTFE